RERRGDILPLAQHFIRKYDEENNRDISDQLSPEVLALLEQYTWPGNVRELENVMERAVVIAPGDEVTRQCLPAEIADPSNAPRGHAARERDIPCSSPRRAPSRSPSTPRTCPTTRPAST